MLPVGTKVHHVPSLQFGQIMRGTVTAVIDDVVREVLWEGPMGRRRESVRTLLPIPSWRQLS